MTDKASTIMWVEDDIDVLDPAVKPLRKLGFEILECRTYFEAIRRLDEFRSVDLVLLDLLLPSGSLNSVEEQKQSFFGLELLRRLRAEGIAKPVLVFSAYVDGINVKETLNKLNVMRDIRKPVRPSQLKKEVLSLLAVPSGSCLR